MINAYKTEGITFKKLTTDQIKDHLNEIIWIDLCYPTVEEECLIESLLGIGIPTRDEMHEIELSSRLYKRNGTLFTTLTMVTHGDTLHPESHAVTFVLHHTHLITVRYVDTPPFTTFMSNTDNVIESCQKGSTLFLWLLEHISDQLADLLEFVARGIEETSHQIFVSQNGTSTGKLNFKKVLSSIGTYENILSKSQESLFNFTRLLSFISESSHLENPPEQKAIQVMMRDLPPLIEHASFLSNKITFLLDATLGMINIEQNAIIKIVSVVAVVFLPPTLVASIYGMNFHVMPELSWEFGYPLAILLMFLAGLLPYKYFKYKRWL